MKRILLSVISTVLFAFPLMSAANGVICSVDVALNPITIFGGTNAFQSTCTNNTSNRNYTDFSILNGNQTGVVTVSTSCGGYLPVGGSCVITGVFSPTSASNNSFTLGLTYGGTNYPTYPGLSFSTSVKTLNFTSTTGPYGGDTTFNAHAKIPGGTNGLYYALGTNNDLGQSDIYLFNGTAFVATNFPLTTVTATDFSSSVIMAADSTANLYVGAVITATPTAADAVWRFDFETSTWASTNFNPATMGNVVSLTINKDDRVFATTSNGGDRQVWEYDPIAVGWVNTNAPTTLSGFQFNQKPTYLVADHADGVLYGMTTNTVYKYTPSPTPGVGVWFNTLASAIPSLSGIESLYVDSGDILYAGVGVGGVYDIYFYTSPTTWTSTQFAADTSLSVPSYPSMIDVGGDLLASGVTGIPSTIRIWKLAPPNDWTQTASFPTTEAAISFETESDDIVYAASFSESTGRMSLWQYISDTNTWLTLNFPSASNTTGINLMAVNSDEDLYALMLNGSYVKPAGSGTWVQANTGLYALTSHYKEILDGTLFTLNARQSSSPSCSNSGGDPNSVYDADWSDFPNRGGFIDVFKNPLGTWADTGFPHTIGPAYLYTPLVSNNNDLYGLVLISPGPQDIYHYGTSWTSTSFTTQASGATVYLCMQGALATDPSSNLYAVTHSGTTYTIWKYTKGTNLWAATTGIPAATLVLQLMVDGAGNPYAIVGTDVYRYNGTTWSTTSFPGLAGSPKHLSADPSNNIYAVTNSLQVWKYTAATASWGSAMLGGTGIPATAGKIYRQLLADRANNLYARTRNTITDVDSVWKYTASSNTWSDLASLTGFPTGAIIQDLTIDEADNVFLSTAQGLYVYSGSTWFQLSTLYTDRFLTNGAGNYYQVTNNQGVYLGSLT